MPQKPKQLRVKLNRPTIVLESKKPVTKKGLQTLLKTVAPEKVKKARQIFDHAKKVTPNDLRTTKSNKDMLSNIRRQATFNEAVVSGALKLSDLNKPVFKLIEKKIKEKLNRK